MSIFHTLLIVACISLLISSGIGYSVYERYVTAKEQVSETVSTRLAEFADLHPKARAEINKAFETDNFLSQFEYEELLAEFKELSKYMQVPVL